MTPQPTIKIPVLDEAVPDLQKDEVVFTVVGHDYLGDPIYEEIEITVETVNVVRFIGADRKFCNNYKQRG